MSLLLITGPANAAKAGAVLERLRAARPRDPLLVVPTAADVEHYQRELAASGFVFGAQVLTFRNLVREIARRAGLRARPLGPTARDRVVRAAIAGVPLRALHDSAGMPGFARAAGALFAELQRSLVPPARFTAALRSWAEPSRAEYAGELAALYSGYLRRLEALGRPDQEGYAWAALDALRAKPAAWGGRPVFFYGFDDLTPTERDAVETLVRHCETEVCIALPYEPGRVAFAGRAATVEELRPLATETLHLPERSEHYAPTARPALHHLERNLFEPGPERVAPNGAIRLLEAGGERAEAELVGAEVLELMRKGIEPRDIAVLLRGDAATTALVAQVLEGYGIPVTHDHRVPFRRTRLGAGVLAAARAALPDGSAADLLTWLRTPGRLADPALADRLEARIRRRELRTAARARRAWEEELGGEPLTALDALAEAAAAGAAALLEAIEAETQAIWIAPHRRRGEALTGEDRSDARVAADLRSAAGELRQLAAADEALLGTPQDAPRGARRRACARAARAPTRPPASCSPTRWPSAPAASAPCSSAASRTPSSRSAPTPEPFLSDDDRRALAAADRAGPAAARGRAGPRALALLRRRLAPRGHAVPLLALVGRGGRAARRVRVPRRRPRALHRRALGGARHAAARRRHLGAEGRAHPARAAPRLRRRGRRAGAAAAGRARDRRRARPARRAPDGAGPRPRVLRRLRRRLARRLAAAPATGSSPTRTRCAAARSPTPCSSARWRC